MADALDRIVGADQVAPENRWCRDEWVIGDGPANEGGARREYLFHLWPPRFRCWVVEVGAETGDPGASEEPAASSAAAPSFPPPAPREDPRAGRPAGGVAGHGSGAARITMDGTLPHQEQNGQP